MNYQLKDGVVEEDHYGWCYTTVCSRVGIRLAKLSTLPESVLTRASQVSETLTAQTRQRTRNSTTRILSERRRLILQLQETLKQAAGSSMDDESMARWLQRVQARFVEDFASTDWFPRSWMRICWFLCCYFIVLLTAIPCNLWVFHIFMMPGTINTPISRSICLRYCKWTVPRKPKQ